MSIGKFLLLPVVVLPAVIVLLGLFLSPVESLWARALIMLVGLPAAIWFVLYMWFALTAERDAE